MKRDESGSDDGSRNLSGAGLDLTGQATRAHQSEASDSHADRVRPGMKTPSKHPHKSVAGGFSRNLYLLTFFLCTSVFLSLIMPIAVLVSPQQKRNHQSLDTRRPSFCLT